MFCKILIANRGEIACRVMRTARRMGVATVAVYSEADASALHVAMADEARLIGPPPARDSYLNIDAVIAAARDTGAEAVHPGYGFLSENAEFAEACAAAGIVFIGPPPAAIRAMGSKSAAKALMAAHGVPVVPGYHGGDQSPEHLLVEAERVGFPVLIKASAGGGGRGMRIVNNASEFARALDGAKREAKNAFADDTVLIERYLTAPRHIEVQVFGDMHGNIVHLYERDCSIQRRHQKVVEEAPAPGLGAATRQALGETAVAAARAVDYVGAGTVEFIMEGSGPGAGAPGGFFFMEMNTRLQVEHPVTEEVTGTDLVEWQLLVASGEKFTRTQQQINLRGHAIEVRLYAENPARNFLPATGTVNGLHFPEGDGIRVEIGIRQGDTVTPFYDPMLAKIIAAGSTRVTAQARLARALADTAVLGVTTNLAFLSRVVTNDDFAAGAVDTGFIEGHRDALLSPSPPPDLAIAAAALYRLNAHDNASSDPWSRTDGWRLNLAAAPRTAILRHGDTDHAVSAQCQAGVWLLTFDDDRTIRAESEPLGDSRLAVTLDGARHPVRVLEHGTTIAIFAGGQSWAFEHIDPLAPPQGHDTGAGRLTSPMPGRVVQLLVVPGDTVRQGQPMMVVEAMKMEHTIAAPRDGTVAAVHYAVGDLVEEGADLIALAEPEPAG